MIAGEFDIPVLGRLLLGHLVIGSVNSMMRVFVENWMLSMDFDSSDLYLLNKEEFGSFVSKKVIEFAGIIICSFKSKSSALYLASLFFILLVCLFACLASQTACFCPAGKKEKNNRGNSYLQCLELTIILTWAPRQVGKWRVKKKYNNHNKRF